MIEDIYAEILPELKGKLVFDIGAAVGKMTRIFLDAGSRVLAVEPQKERTLKDNPNFMGDVTVLNACVSDSDGSIEFNECRSSPNISSCNKDWKDGLYKGNYHKWVTKPKSSVTLDSLIKYFGKPYYIKIDVEGYENKVLEGLSSKCDLVSFEYTGGYEQVFLPCLTRLELLGFTELVVFKKIKENTAEGRTVRFDRIKMSSFEECKDYYKKIAQYSQGDILAR